MRKLLTVFFCFFFINASADPVKSVVYKGKLGTHDILLYIGKGEGCGGEDFFYTGMYSYDNGKHWLLLDISHNTKGFYCMVENKFTGVLLLTEKEDVLTGTWQSNDRERSLPVNISEQKLSDKKLQEYYEAWDKLNYALKDC